MKRIWYWLKVYISIACDWIAENYKICLSLWAKQNFIKINDKACENLCTVSHYWHLKKTFKKTAWLMNWVKEIEYSFCSVCLNAWVTHIAVLRVSCSKAQT